MQVVGSGCQETEKSGLRQNGFRFCYRCKGYKLRFWSTEHYFRKNKPNNKQTFFKQWLVLI
jgi:hypothetical protein